MYIKRGEFCFILENKTSLKGKVHIFINERERERERERQPIKKKQQNIKVIFLQYLRFCCRFYKVWLN
jgi:hypothetical protein